MSKFSMFLRSYPVLLIVLGLASSSVVSSATIVYRPAISAPTADETFFPVEEDDGEINKVSIYGSYIIGTAEYNKVCLSAGLGQNVVLQTVGRLRGGHFWTQGLMNPAMFRVKKYSHQCLSGVGSCDLLSITMINYPAEKGSFIVRYDPQNNRRSRIYTTVEYGPQEITLTSPNDSVVLDPHEYLKFEVRVFYRIKHAATVCESIDGGPFQQSTLLLASSPVRSPTCPRSVFASDVGRPQLIYVGQHTRRPILEFPPRVIFLTFSSCDYQNTELASRKYNITGSN